MFGRPHSPWRSHRDSRSGSGIGHLERVDSRGSWNPPGSARHRAQIARSGRGSGRSRAARLAMPIDGAACPTGATECSTLGNAVVRYGAVLAHCLTRTAESGVGRPRRPSGARDRRFGGANSRLSMGWLKPRSMPKDNAATISASRTGGASGSAPIGADATPGCASRRSGGQPPLACSPLPCRTRPNDGNGRRSGGTDGRLSGTFTPRRAPLSSASRQE